MTRHSNPHVRRFLIASSLAFGLGSSAIAQSDERGDDPSTAWACIACCALDLSDARSATRCPRSSDQSPAMHEPIKAARAASRDLEKLASAPAFDRERARPSPDTERRRSPTWTSCAPRAGGACGAAHPRQRQARQMRDHRR